MQYYADNFGIVTLDPNKVARIQKAQSLDIKNSIISINYILNVITTIKKLKVRESLKLNNSLKMLKLFKAPIRSKIQTKAIRRMNKNKGFSLIKDENKI